MTVRTAKPTLRRISTDMKLRIFLGLILLVAMGAFAQRATFYAQNVTTATAPVPVLIASGVVAQHGTGAQANPITLNTVNSTLCVAVLAGFGSGIANEATITDSLSNTWNYLTLYTNGETGLWIAYTFSHSGGALATGATQVFTVANGANVSGSAAIYCFSNTLTTSSVYDTSSGANGPLTSPFQPGSVTPTSGDIVVTGWSEDGNPSSTNTIAGSGSDTAWSTPVGSVNSTDEVVGGSYLIGASGSAVNPTWSVSGSGLGTIASAIASFKAAP